MNGGGKMSENNLIGRTLWLKNMHGGKICMGEKYAWGRNHLASEMSAPKSWQSSSENGCVTSSSPG